MSALEVKRPLSATLGAVFSIIGGVLYLSLLSLATALESVPADAIIGTLFIFFFGFLILVGAFLILRRSYREGGTLVLFSGFFLFFFELAELRIFFPIFIILLIGGILGLVSKEKIALRVLDVIRLYGRLKIDDLASKIGKTEADVELAIMELQAKGEPIKFEAETREVIYMDSYGETNVE